MNKEKIIRFLLVPLFLMLLSDSILAQERSIYVGDLIQIKIFSNNWSKEELKEKFQDFEIVNMEDQVDGYLLTLRSFDTGEKKIQLGNKEIVIDIKSTLDEIKRDGIFEGNSTIEKAKGSLRWLYVFYGLLVVFLLAGTMTFMGYRKKRKSSALNPYQYFINETGNISVDDKHYLAKLTFYFKQYIEDSYFCFIRGKTSTELIDKIRDFPGLQSHLASIQSWLAESDYFKYTGMDVSREKKRELYGDLMQLVKKIQEVKEGEL